MFRLFGYGEVWRMLIMLDSMAAAQGVTVVSECATKSMFVLCWGFKDFDCE